MRTRQKCVRRPNGAEAHRGSLSGVERASYQSPRLEKPTYREEAEDDEPLLLSIGDVIQSIAFPSRYTLGRPMHAQYVGIARSSFPPPMDRIPGLARLRTYLSPVPTPPCLLSTL